MNKTQMVKSAIEEKFGSDIEDLYDYFENNEDVEISYDLWENSICSELELVDIEAEVYYIRKTRSVIISE